jgi:DNA invertase Pin-like site-specific DNA recombinase
MLSPARFARSSPHQWLLLDACKQSGCRVILMAHPCGDAPHGHLLAQRQGMMAEDARSQMADRTRRGRGHKARQAAGLPWAYRAYGSRYLPKHAELPP